MVNGTGDTTIPRPSGLDLGPMRALRYAADRVDVSDVLAPPYDVISPAERGRLASRSPYGVVNLTLPAGADPYAAAAAQARRWRDDGILVADERPGLYVYEMAAGGHVQRGLLGALALTPAEDGIVLPHENTMAGPVADRLALLEAAHVDLEPIFLVYDGGGAASEVVAAAGEAPELLDVTGEDGVRHRLWAVTDEAQLAAVAADLSGRRAVIADGHHRYATYLKHQQAHHEAGDGPGPWDRGLALLVDATAFGPQVHAIHRVVPGLDPGAAVERAAGAFSVTPVEGGPAAALAGLRQGQFVVSDGTRAWLLDRPDADAVAAALPADRSAAWRALDVAVAHHFLITALWGVVDDEQAVRFAHSAEEACSEAAASGGTALLLAPTPVQQVADVAAAGDRMPRKSTLFTPKPATGVVLRAYADAVDGAAATRLADSTEIS